MKNIFFRSYKKIINSIAFYPTIMSLLSIAFAIFIIDFEYSDTSADIKEKIKVALVTNEESARLILGTIVGGIISLTVFSFSMVMVVLNRASATLSPRVIPGMISKKFHQVVLGFYIATIIYSLMMIINVHHEDQVYSVPGLGIFLAMIFAVTCLGLFVYFIHSISISIQVDNIIYSIYLKTLKKLRTASENNPPINSEPVNEEMKFEIKTPNSGYFKDVNVQSLLSFLKKKDLKLRMNVPRGFFALKDYPYISVNKNLNGDKNIKAIRTEIQFYNEEFITDHYTYGFKQISEIAIKALSPGINDPGTALKALDMLMLLFIERMKISYPEYDTDDTGTVRILYSELTFAQLLYITLGPIREYGKNDAMVMIKLLEMIKNFMYADKVGRFEETLIQEAQSIIEDTIEGNRNERDKRAINDELEKLNKVSSFKFQLI